jgi:Transposase domain (DUF772)
MRIRDELGEVYADARFAAAFGVRGRPGISPGQLMMASVLQFSENLTDRQAAEAVRDRMTWKYALGLELDDPVALYGSLGVGGRGGWMAEAPAGWWRGPVAGSAGVGGGYRCGCGVLAAAWRVGMSCRARCFAGS